MTEESDLQRSQNDFREYDIIVYGTGLPESILSAACSRAGLSVLHLDSNDYYGSAWASFNLEQMMLWACSETRATLEAPLGEVQLDDVSLNPGERFVFSMSHDGGFSSAEFDWLAEQTEQETMEVSEESGTTSSDSETNPRWTKARICKESRRFSIDLTPELLLSRGHAIDTLISSGVSRYGEYKLVDRILTFADNKLQEVPCTRSDVFQSDKISLLEKRMLMKFVSLCHNYDQERDWWQEYADQPFKSFLDQQNLSQLVKHYICNAVVDASDHTTTAEGLKSAHDFLDATGRYGSSPFLWPLYGCGELSQGFCRLSAVFGGTYCLRKRIQALIIDEENRVLAIVFDNKRVTCNKNFICSRHMFSHELSNSALISRAVLITNRSVLPSAKEHISYLNFCSEDQKTVRLLEIGSGAMICPKGLYVVYLSTRFENSARRDLTSAIDTLFATTSGSSDKPDVLFQLFYTQRVSTSDAVDEPEPFVNFVSTHLPFYNLHSERLFDTTCRAFRKHFPDLELFPPLPDHQADEELELYSNPGHQASSDSFSNDAVSQITNESN